MHNNDIEVNKPFIRFKKPDGEWTIDIDANLIKVVTRGVGNRPTVLGIESESHGASILELTIDPVQIMDQIEQARK